MAHDRQIVSDIPAPKWPAVPLVVARITRWFPTKGYGFAHTADFGDVFVPATLLPRDPVVGALLHLHLHVDHRGRRYGVQAAPSPD